MTHVRRVSFAKTVPVSKAVVMTATANLPFSVLKMVSASNVMQVDPVLTALCA